MTSSAHGKGLIRRRVVAVLTAVLCVWGLAVAPAASAHATVVSTDPADGAVLPTAPTRVTVTYNEAVSLQLGALRVFAPDGSQVEIGSADHLAGQPRTASVPLKSGLKNGTYVVSWRVISADSHPVRGAWTFSIGTTSAPNSGGAEAAPSGSRTVGVVYGVARWLAYLGFAALAGGSLLLIAFAPKLAPDRRLRLLIGGGWFTLLVGTVASLLLQGPYGGGFGLGRTFDVDVLRATLHTRLGTALAWRLILLGAAGVMVSWIATRLAEASVRTRQAAGGFGAAVAVALAATWSIADHSGTGSQVALALPADVLHLLAMATWIGGLAALAASVLGPRVAGIDDEARLKLVRRFSTTAFTAVCVLAATGVYQGWRQVRHWDPLFNTDYGRMLIIKSSIFLVLIALGFLARRILAASSPDLARLRRSVAAEFGLAIVVLAVTALLVESQPASEPAPKAGPVTVSSPFDTGSANGTGTVDVALDPARVGADQLQITVLDKTGKPESVPEVDASLALPAQQLGPIKITLQAAGPGHHTASNVLVPMSGAWQVLVTVRTTDIDQATVILNVAVGK
ncbi:copper transport protein [Catenulispora sp. GAS73]|uniref:copper resistance CopC/CopD family protein n=1 Tax=Catenulispora sp. GAS73 TaxID=3156269 RepID=UPI003517EEC9